MHFWLLLSLFSTRHATLINAQIHGAVRGIAGARARFVVMKKMKWRINFEEIAGQGSNFPLVNIHQLCESKAEILLHQTQTDN